LTRLPCTDTDELHASRTREALRPAEASVSQVSDDALGRRPARQRAGAV
jgi:hypothetical protein